MKVTQVFILLLLIVLFSGCRWPGSKDETPPTPNSSATNVIGITVTTKSELVTSESGSKVMFDAVLNSQPESEVTLHFSTTLKTEALFEVDSVNNTYNDVISLVFTPDNWDVLQNMVIVGQDDNLIDLNQTYSITLSSVETTDVNYIDLQMQDIFLTNLDDDAAGITKIVSGNVTTNESGTTTKFSLVLNSEPVQDVAIIVSSQDVTEGLLLKDGRDQTPSGSFELVFTSLNWNVPQVINIVGEDDADVDGNQTYLISFTNTKSEDAFYSGLAVEDISVINIDDDQASINILLPATQLQTTESGGAVSFDIVLSNKPLAAVSFTANSSNSLEGLIALNNSQKSPANALDLIFTPADWDIPKTLTVIGQDDAFVDGSQQYRIEFSPSASEDSIFNNMLIDTVLITNIDNDSVGVIVNSAPTLDTNENGGIATLELTLSARPNNNVVIDVATSDTSEGLVLDINSSPNVVAASSFIFTSDNWSAPQLVTLVGQNDTLVDGDQIYSLVMAINQGLTTDTSGYSNLILNNVPAINRDTTPAPAISVSPITGLVTSEAGGITSFSVVLEAPPSDKVVIDVVSNTSEGIVANNNSSALYSGNLSIYFDTTNWSDPQTISVKGVDDHVADGDTTYNIILDINLILTQDATGYSLLNPDDVSVTNLALVCEGVATGGKVVNGVTKFSGQACKGTSFYEVTGLTASTIYNVGLFGLTANADLSVYSSSDYSAAAACSPLLAGILDEHCQVSSDSLGKLWISVDANSSIGGTIFQLIVVDTPALLEGSVDVPLSLSYVNNLPYSGRVDTTISYYQLTGLAADTAYDVYLSQLTGDAQLSVYANTLLECQSTNAGLADEACMAFSDSSGNLVIQVDGTASFAGATYTIGVNAYSGSPAEGTATARLPLAYNGAVLPHSGSVSSRASYYQVNGLVANVDYVVSLTGLTANVDLSVSDPGTNSVVCGSANAGIIDEWCATTANVSGTLWIQVNPINASTGANYVLNVSAAPLPQGTLAQPLPVTSALSAPYAGSVGVVDSSYYSITGLTPGAAYEVSLTGLSGNADLYLYLTAKMNVIGCQSNNVGTASEICTLIADVSGNLWIKVDGSASAGGATFTLNVNLGPPTEIVLFNQGVALYDLADYVNATIKFDELLALYPAGQFAAEANLYIGKSKYRLLDYVAAINKFEFVFTNYANSLVIYDAHYWKGRALAKQNNLLLARTEYQFVIDNAGVSGVAGDASFQLAKTLYDAFNYTQAIVDFKAVLAKYSVFDKADNTQYYLAKSYHALANYTQARLEYNLLISNYVFSTWVDNAQYQIGRTYYDEATGTSSLTLFPTAIAEFQKVFAYPLATSADSAQYYIARSYHEMQNFTQARIEYDLVIVNYALGIWGDNAQYQIGKTYYDEAGINNNLALYDTAVIEFRKVFSFTLSSSSDSAQYYIARSFHAQQKYLEARVEYDLLLTTPAYSLSTLLDDGQYRKGKSYYDEAGVTANTLLYDSAVPELQKVLALYPSSTNAAAAQYYIGRSYHKIANISKLPLDYDAARTAYDKVSALNYPASSFLDDALYQRGATFYSEANFTTAILEFDKVVTLYITTNRADDALYYRGRSHQKKSMPDLLLARSDFASLISLFPSSIRADNAQYYTGLSYHTEGDCVAESAAMTLLLQDKYKGSIYVSKAQAHIDGIIAGTHTCI